MAVDFYLWQAYEAWCDETYGMRALTWDEAASITLTCLCELGHPDLQPEVE